ncbi:hypothetical protein PVAND_006336 [Polypedilum vanderplanki]|uniref:Uncharacterized protein n=1 Tax=Polypedilum vanderplanki TaxID=319348 RepID=A0A9J6C2W2_POLVA|nr:hypothetical protein PVAND_006336 [Polypedilum vanderplanki]
MATEEKKQESIILKEPLQVPIEVPEKKIIAVEQEHSQTKVAVGSENNTEGDKDMNISMETDDVIPPNNQTAEAEA